jgi:hypothetical protein
MSGYDDIMSNGRVFRVLAGVLCMLRREVLVVGKFVLVFSWTGSRTIPNSHFITCDTSRCVAALLLTIC